MLISSLNKNILLLEKLTNKRVFFEEEEFFVPRDLENREFKHKQKIYKLLNQEVIKGNLDLGNLDFITNMGNVKEDKSYLDLSNSSITSLPKGLIVG